ncbi:EAL domain-containing protein [Granulosicoccus antarcticus]|nr:EAL domain-containing protein [Granulosicoccus antarcticus]
MSVNENARMAAVLGLDLLDTEPDAEFDSIVQAASALCDMPMCLIALLDEHRYWFKAAIGMSGMTEVAKEISFCKLSIDCQGLLQIPDCTQDVRSADNPLVLGAPGLRFYAGIALSLSDGTRVGTLCILDTKPGALSDMQKQVLTHLAQAASYALESRRVALTQIASESTFRTLCAVSPLGIFSTDIHGFCTYTNERFQALFGLSEHESLGSGWRQAVHPDDRNQGFAAWDSGIGSRVEVVRDFRVCHMDGRVLTVTGTLRPVFTADNKLISFVGSVEDITERRNHQAQMERSLTFMRQTGALAGVGGWELNLSTSQAFWSDQTCIIHGVDTEYQPDIQAGLDFFLPEARDILVNALQALTADGDTLDEELRLRRADGRIIWVRVRGEAVLREGEVVRLRGAIQDIDNEVRQRIALKNAHDRISIATQSGDIGVWEWDVESGHIDWTPQMYKLYGVEPDATSLSLDWWSQLIHPDDQQVAEIMLSGLMEGEGDLDTEFRVVRPDGSVRHLRSCAHIRRDVNGRALTLLGVNWDVTSLRQLSMELAEQHELLHVTLQSIEDAVITADTAGLIVWLNPAAELLTGWGCGDALGKPLEDIYKVCDEQSGLPLKNPVTECLVRDQPLNCGRDAVLLARDGSRFGIEESAAPIRDSQGQLFGVVLIFRDVTEQRRLRAEMNFRATHDELTQIFNRSEFESRLRKTLNSLRDNTEPCHALMFIDLDEFKLVNDACGHPVGDHLLRQIAGLLGQTLRAEDTLARLGGDEFGVILNNCSVTHAQQIAQQICHRMDDFRFAHGIRRFRVGASIGLVPLNDRWASPASIMQAADTSCYAAKEAGRNRVHLWLESDQNMRNRRGDMQWAARLEQSLDENRFELYAQKLVSLTDDCVGLSAEVLIRLSSEGGRVILPGAFLPAAERFHLATRIDRWVLQKSIQTLAELPSLKDVRRLWINLSGQSVGDREFHRDAIEMLTQAGSEICECICLEITETAVVININDAADFILSLRALNVKTALDDFGAGASSFSYLRNLPVDALKIDGQFIGNLVENPLNAAAVRCFVDVAEVVGLRTVAEYVQTPEALAYVKELGVDFAQGFLMHEPEPIGQLLRRSLGAQSESNEVGGALV